MLFAITFNLCLLLQLLDKTYINNQWIAWNAIQIFGKITPVKIVDANVLHLSASIT
ncbi:hypothetical protein GLYMA_03G137250v4 [Glycine max]|nr:hypothetical protein GLYMA_03G137250v4 [Glycine max]KAH1069884.1 hypothetical protein GYH30_007158 [Glycine max]